MEVLGHAPLSPGENEGLATASLIADPSKSWAIYAELHESGEAQYYRFDIASNQKIYVMLFKPTSPDQEDFLPSFALMGPGLTSLGQIPDFVETPSDGEVLVVEGQQPAQATYEPFSPSTFYSLANITLDNPETGTYYVAVYEESRGGRYGLAIGYVESYAIDEWILIPINLISVYQWEGQSAALIFAPTAVTLVAGLILILWRNRTQGKPFELSKLVGTLAGLLFIGSGVNLLFQMTIKLVQTHVSFEIIITLMLALAPILLGVGILRIVARKEEEVRLRWRVYLALLGVIGLFVWAGLLLGPILAVVAAVLPYRNKAR